MQKLTIFFGPERFVKSLLQNDIGLSMYLVPFLKIFVKVDEVPQTMTAHAFCLNQVASDCFHNGVFKCFDIKA